MISWAATTGTNTGELWVNGVDQGSITNSGSYTLSNAGSISIYVVVDGIASNTITLYVSDPTITLDGDGTSLTAGDKFPTNWTVSNGSTSNGELWINGSDSGLAANGGAYELSAAGTYSIYVVVDGYTSNTVTVTVSDLPPPTLTLAARGVTAGYPLESSMASR